MKTKLRRAPCPPVDSAGQKRSEAASLRPAASPRKLLPRSSRRCRFPPGPAAGGFPGSQRLGRLRRTEVLWGGETWYPRVRQRVRCDREVLPRLEVLLIWWKLSTCLCTILLMGQRSGRQERSKKLELALKETMEAEAEVQNNEEAEELKTKAQKFPSVFGVADLKNGAVGLYNVGQSCCLNSLLQVFLMNTRFTGILRRITVPPCDVQKRRNVPYQMLLLLEEMQCGKRKAVSPIALASCLSVYRVKLFVQHDAAQLFLTLWNLIKKQMKKPELVEELNDLYAIGVQEHLACQKCSSETKRNSSMLTLPVPLLDSSFHMLKTLEECLQYFFRPEELTDHNMCFCEQCGRKTPFLQSIKLVHLPQTLIIHLKRFCFEKSAYIHKLSHCLPFPQDLDFSAVLTANQCQAADSEKAAWKYEIFAVVAHSGSSNCGHYCAYIRSLTECKWYCFNDSEVCQVSWDDVKCTFGHSNLHWMRNFQPLCLWGNVLHSLNHLAVGEYDRIEHPQEHQSTKPLSSTQENELLPLEQTASPRNSEQYSEDFYYLHFVPT